MPITAFYYAGVDCSHISILLFLQRLRLRIHSTSLLMQLNVGVQNRWKVFANRTVPPLQSLSFSSTFTTLKTNTRKWIWCEFSQRALKKFVAAELCIVEPLFLHQLIACCTVRSSIVTLLLSCYLFHMGHPCNKQTNKLLKQGRWRQSSFEEAKYVHVKKAMRLD